MKKPLWIMDPKVKVILELVQFWSWTNWTSLWLFATAKLVIFRCLELVTNRNLILPIKARTKLKMKLKLLYLKSMKVNSLVSKETVWLRNGKLSRTKFTPKHLPYLEREVNSETLLAELAAKYLIEIDTLY